MIARKLGVDGSLGKQLDSLADMISFGLLPGFICYILLSQALVLDSSESVISNYLLLPAIFITCSAALRLGRFNISKEQDNQFIGLPSPAGAMFFSGLMLVQKIEVLPLRDILFSKYAIYSYIFFIAFLMNSNLIFLKFSFNKKTVTNPFVLIMFSILIAITFFVPQSIVFLAILLYIIVSFLTQKTKISI